MSLKSTLEVELSFFSKIIKTEQKQYLLNWDITYGFLSDWLKFGHIQMSCLQQQPFISLFYCEATEQATNWNRKKWTRVPHLTPKSKGCLFLCLKDHSATRRKRRASKFFCCFFLYSWQYQHYRYCLVLNNRATQKEKSLSNNFISARSQIQHSSELG